MRQFPEQVSRYDAPIVRVKCAVCGYQVTAREWSSASASITAHTDYAHFQPVQP